MKKAVAVLVSGGVDSSVALALLKQKNISVKAYYLKIWLEDELSYLGDCPWEEDLSYAKAVCKQLDVELEILSMQRAYWKSVVQYTIKSIKNGFTPNPDMLCNKAVKFGAFYDAVSDKHDMIATGHYARIAHTENNSTLHMTNDPIKDQTYFLAQMSKEQLSRALFPLGDLIKDNVRNIAKTLNLPTATRPDSQGICFLGKISFTDFVKHHLGTQKGELVDWKTGKTCGEHDGFWFYTIGQRKGIGLSHGPWYVVSKNIEKNIVYISSDYHDANLHKRSDVPIENINWLYQKPEDGAALKVKLRHGPHLSSAHISYQNDNKALLKLKSNDQGIAPGQFAVMYTESGICIGSGMISYQNRNAG